MSLGVLGYMGGAWRVSWVYLELFECLGYEMGAKTSVRTHFISKHISKSSVGNTEF